MIRLPNDLRLENFSSIGMRFDRVDLALTVAGQDAGRPSQRIDPQRGQGIAPV